ncbi:TIGR02302 family protein [Aestuariivirga sp.]|uniref:TIGR02302 family protein n=1 Tax=Aestuariivirga sp. TaxID=2650926 RepID=UPI0039E648BA
MNSAPPRSVSFAISRARLALAAEALWALLLWPLLIAGLTLAFIFSGLPAWLPPALRLAILILAAIAFAVSLWPLRHFRWPTEKQAMRRVEMQSGLTHRPVSSADDQLAEGNLALWDVHRKRELARLTDLKAGAPRSRWSALDPKALRLPVALALIASVVLGPGTPRRNFADALAFTRPAAVPGQMLDAWLKPPAYTAKPPILLTSPAMVEHLRAEPELTVPENSVLTLRLSQAKAPELTLTDPETGAPLKGIVPKTQTGATGYQAEVKLTRPALISLTDNGNTVAQWRILLTPDRAPTITMTELPSGDSSGTTTVKWKAEDDYGVTGITADISLSDDQDDGYGIDGNGIFLYDPPKFPIVMRKSAAKTETGTSSANLAEHPWAGFMVEMTLTATDAAGHRVDSEIRRFRMPERIFTKPLARALIEQRRHLIVKPEENGQVAQMLSALVEYPQGLIDRSGDYLAIAAIISRLNAAADQDDVDVAVNLLWQAAVGIEDGQMASAKAELEAARKELEQALAEGAPPERIAKLMDKMRSAMDRYMKSMREEAQRNGQQDQGGDRQNQNLKMVTPQDLQKMLDMIDRLAQSGANDAAKDLLAQLDDILRNLQMVPQQGQAQNGQNDPLNNMLDQLTDLMRRQQKLMDQTQRMPEQGDGGITDQPGQEPGNKGGQPSPNDLAGQQGALGDLLDQMMREMGRNGMSPPQSFGDAGRNMKGAEGSLRGQDRDQALGQQGEALSQLREGAKGLAQQLRQRGQGQQGSQGRDGEARGDDTDPLGRPNRSNSPDTGPDRNILPTEQALRRAREILDALRSKVGEQGLQPIERGYIERLLRGLY